MSDASDTAFSSRALCAVTHGASQVARRWLPLPGTLAPEAAAPLPCAAALRVEQGEAHWRDLVGTLAAAQASPLPWLPRYLAKHDVDGARLAAALAGHLRSVGEAGALYVTAADAAYPELLRRIEDPPAALTVLGDVRLLKRSLVAVVGSRKASVTAVRESFALGRGLAERGVAVVSGGAFGCDIAAHQGVLAAGLPQAPAVCVFAGGLGDLYPRTNEPVFRRLRASGAALVSERLWDAGCRRPDFPARNRLISGLAGVVAIMQAGERSGAVVTARLALEQGRDVAVLLHPEDDLRAQGSAALLRDGAPGFPSAAALIEALLPSSPTAPWRDRHPS
jgi:DNA processing protein